MAASTAGIAEPASGWRGDDFPAWVSPMLVKELRQGIQSGAFAWTFMGLQAVMFLVVATMLAAGDDAVRSVEQLVWVPVTLAVAIVVPLRGLAAVSSERVGNNLDLVRLTHLSATRIVVGKWLAIVAQSVLLATAVLPHLVLRYFFGGVNVARDLVGFAWMLGTAAVVAAAAVAASTRPVRERIGLVFVSLLLGNGLLQALFGFRMGGGGVPLPAALGVALGCLYTAILLEYAAAAIAAPAENHAARKRGLALVIVTAWVVAACVAGRGTFWAVVAATIVPLVVIAAEALCERPSMLASVHAAFARRGAAGRLAAFALAPGWATGVVFVTLAALGCLVAVVVSASRFAPERMTGAAGLAILGWAAVVYPLPAVALFRWTHRQPMLYVIVQVCCLFGLAFQGMLAGSFRGDAPLAHLAIMPLAAFLWALGSDEQSRISLAIAAGVVMLVVHGLVANAWIHAIAATRRQVAAAAGAIGRAPEASP